MIPNPKVMQQLVARTFKGKLSQGTLRRVVGSTVTLHAFEGIRDSISAYFSTLHGVPLTDVDILILAGSIKITPSQDDKVFIRDQWFQLRKLVEIDPVGATYRFTGFEIPAP